MNPRVLLVIQLVAVAVLGRAVSCNADQCGGHIESDTDPGLIECYPHEGGGFHLPIGEFIADNDPSSVLRLCHSHKFVVGAYMDAKHQADRSFAPASYIKGLAAGLELAVHEIARGYGLTEEEK